MKPTRFGRMKSQSSYSLGDVLKNNVKIKNTKSKKTKILDK